MIKSEDVDVPEDNIYFKKAFKENKGIWLMYGGFFLGPLWIPVNFVITGSVLNVLMTITVVKIYKSDLVAAIENVHFIILVSAEILGMITLLRKRKLIVSIYTLIGKDYFDYENTLDDECLETKRSAMEKAKRRKYFIQRIFVSCIFCACITVSVLRPVLKILYFDPSEGTPDDGFVRVAMVTVWTPFDKYQWYSVAFIWYCECVIAWNTPSIVFGSTFFFLFALEDLGVQLQLLKKSLVNVIQRAKRIDGPIEEGIKLCLKYSIRHHQILFTHKDEIQMVLALPFLALFVGFSIMLCMSGYIFTLFLVFLSFLFSIVKEVALISKMVFGLFLLSETVVLFAFCYFGEEIQELSEEIGDALHETDWVKYSKLMKNYVLIIQIRSRVKMRIDLVGFMDVSRNTFSNISSTAYSYLNLMREFN